MTSRLLFFVVYIVVSCHGFGANRILDQRISIEIKSTPIKRILSAIEETAKVVFSYNPDLIDDNRIVSLSIKNETIEFGLTLIFNKNVRFKELGDHIILLRNEDVEELKSRKKILSSISFEGKIEDARTGEPVEDASIYEVDSRIAVVSNAQGEYYFSVPNGPSVRSLYIRKKGYQASVLVLDFEEDSIIHSVIKLEPLADSVIKIEPRPINKIELPIEERAISGSFVSHDAYLHGENLSEIKEERMAQISLVPSVSFGSNLSTNGLITNNFSLNLLAGYSNGLKGVEIGGLLNMAKTDVKWVQIGGVCNLVGGEVNGIEIGGVLNSVRGNFKGVQVGGIANLNGGNFQGVQLSGIGNLVHKNMNGVQISGVSSIVVGRMNGLQLAGITSISRCGFNGLQFSGITSMTDSLSIGLQFSGILNSALGTYYGGQVSGIFNAIFRGSTYMQVAGIGNITDVNDGIQCAGIINRARQNNGLQLGLINISENSKGFSIGLFNYVKRGYHKTEIGVNETFPLNLTFKSGLKRLYNTYSISVAPGKNPLYAVGLGFGSMIGMGERFALSLDLSGQLVGQDDFFETNHFSTLFKFSSTFDYSIAPWITAFAGPTLNFNWITFKDDEGNYTSPIGEKAFFTENFTQSACKMWLGGRIGLRF